MSQVIKETDNIKVYYEDGLEIIVMNRPKKLNAISSTMMDEISCTLKEAELNDDVMFVVLTGHGNYYSSGVDLYLNPDVETYDEFIDKQVKSGLNFVATFIDFKKILIAVVNGPAFGIAVTTLALCDLVYAVNTATFSTPFIDLGLSSEGCSSYLFPELMGSAKAGLVLYMGKKLSAREANEWNLVSEVFPSVEEIFTVIRSRMSKLINCKEGLMVNKQLKRRFQSETLHEVNKVEWKELERRFRTPEFVGAVLTFKQRHNRNNNKL